MLEDFFHSFFYGAADLLGQFLAQPIWNQTFLVSVLLVLGVAVIAALHMLVMVIQDAHYDAQYDEEMVLVKADNVTPIDDYR